MMMNKSLSVYYDFIFFVVIYIYMSVALDRYNPFLGVMFQFKNSFISFENIIEAGGGEIGGPALDDDEWNRGLHTVFIQILRRQGLIPENILHANINNINAIVLPDEFIEAEEVYGNRIKDMLVETTDILLGDANNQTSIAHILRMLDNNPDDGSVQALADMWQDNPNANARGRYTQLRDDLKVKLISMKGELEDFRSVNNPLVGQGDITVDIIYDALTALADWIDFLNEQHRILAGDEGDEGVGGSGSKARGSRARGSRQRRNGSRARGSRARGSRQRRNRSRARGRKPRRSSTKRLRGVRSRSSSPKRRRSSNKKPSPKRTCKRRRVRKDADGSLNQDDLEHNRKCERKYMMIDNPWMEKVLKNKKPADLFHMIQQRLADLKKKT